MRRILAFLLLTASLYGQDLMPRHAQVQVKTSSCQTFLHLKLVGIARVGDIGHMRIRFPMLCGQTMCYPIPIRTIDTLGNLWVFDPTWGHGYGKDYAEFRMVTPEGSIASGPVEVVVPWSCDLPPADDYGIEAEFDSPWLPQ